MADIYTRILISVQSGSTLRTIKDVSSALGKSGLAGDLEKVAQTARVTGLDIGKLETYQARAGESAARLTLAEARAAEALAHANNLASSGTASLEKLATANAQAALAAEKVKVAKDAAGNAMQKVEASAKHLSDAMEQTSGKSGNAAKSLGNLGDKAKSLVVPQIAALTAGLTGLGLGISDTKSKTEDFQEAMLKTYGANDLTRAQIDAIGNSILELGPKVRKGPQDLAEAFYFVKGAGFDASKSMDILERSGKAAASGLTATEIPANAATAALKAFPALETARAFDIMTAGVNFGKTEWKDFGPAIGAVSLHAKRAGVSFEEATSALSALTNVMPSTDEAATALKSLLQTSSQFEQLNDRATSLGYTFDTNAYKSMNFIERLRYLYKVTGNNEEAVAKLLGQEESLPAITALLTDNASDYSKALESVTHSSGAAESQFKKTGEGGKASWASTQARIEALQIKIGSGLLPVIDSLVTAFNNVITVSVNVAKFFRDNEVAIGTTAGILTILFIPALIKSGIESIIASGRMTTGFIVSVIKAGIAGWTSAGKLALFIGSLIASGVRAAIAGAIIAGQFVLSLIRTGAQAAITGGTLLVSLVPGIVAVIAQSAIAAAVAIPGLIAGFVGWAISAGAAAIATLALTWPILAVIAVIALIVLAVMNWGAIVGWLQWAWAGISGFFVGLFTGIWQFLQDWGVKILLILLGPVGWIILAWRIFPAFFAGIGQSMMAGIKAGINGVIWAINWFIGWLNSMSITIPGVHVGPVQFDGISIGLPKIPLIPHLAKGTANFAGGLALVGEQGPELVNLARGVSVTPLPSDVDRMMKLTLPASEATTTGGVPSYTPRQPGGGTTIIYAPVYNIDTMARSQSEVRRLVDMVSAEQAKDFRLETSGYASGGIH
jgi:TP901 family phage tail tape measure protein